MGRQLTLEAALQNCSLARSFPSSTAVQREFKKVYGHHIAPTRSTIYVVHIKLIERGSVLYKPRHGRPADIISDGNNEAGVRSKPGKSIWRVVLELSINKSTIQRMLQKVIKPLPVPTSDCSNVSSGRLFMWKCGNHSSTITKTALSYWKTYGPVTSLSFISNPA